MPAIKDIQKTSKFKKKAYRPWNMEGEEHSSNSPASPQQYPQTEESPKGAIKVYDINPENVENWQFHDRPKSELGNVDALAEEFLQIGQQQPCIVRPHPDNPEKYELIIGERRWRAAVKAKVPLKAIIREYDDNTAALAQAAENDNRVNLSDYAKGISLSKLIDQKIITQKDLIKRLGKSKQYVSALLSFDKIPHQILEAIGDMSKVSARTAEKIKQLADRGEDYCQGILLYSSKISEGTMGHNKLEQVVKRHLKEGIKTAQTEPLKMRDKKVLSSDGRHIFTWRKDNNHLPSIHFPKSIVSLLNTNKLSLDDLTNKFGEIIENQLEKVKKSAWADKTTEQ